MIVKPVSMLLSLCAMAVVVGSGCRYAAPSNAEATPPRVAQGRPEAATPAPVPAAAKDHRPTIVAFGDSLTAGYGTNAGESYPEYLERDLNARGYRYRVVNDGISGNTSKDGVARLPNVVAEHPALVIVAFGGNDGLRGIPIDDTKRNLDTILSTLEAAHAQVVLGGITLPPNYGSEYIARFNAMYGNQARRHHVPLLPFMLKDVYGVPGDMQDDGIHATAKGNRQVAKNFLPLLLPFLHRSS